MDYTDYSAEDLVMQSSFRAWVKKEDPAAIAFWEKWLARHPEKIRTVEEAKALLRELPDAHYQLPQQEFQHMWVNITKQTEVQFIAVDSGKSSVPKSPVVFLKHWHKIAAIITVLLISGVSLFFLNNHTTFSTAYGETRSVVLPDGSEVILNAHSSLTYPAFWQWRKTREVWLKGEGFFDVRKAVETDGKKFVVHTGSLDVEVLGTSFNVNNRREKTQIVLNTGAVQLQTVEGEKPGNMRMQPGDLVEFSSQEISFTKKVVNPEVYSSWKDNKLFCNGTSLGEIAEIARDRFGLKISFEETDLSTLEISGTLPLDNLDIFLEVLGESTGRLITKDGDQMIIHKK